MLVGGHAVNYHGYVRATLDIDLWVDTKESGKWYYKRFKPG